MCRPTRECTFKLRISQDVWIHYSGGAVASRRLLELTHASYRGERSVVRSSPTDDVETGGGVTTLVTHTIYAELCLEAGSFDCLYRYGNRLTVAAPGGPS